MTNRVTYSDEFAGDAGNHDWSARFDIELTMLHGMPYAGPTYRDALDAARRLLGRAPKEERG